VTGAAIAGGVVALAVIAATQSGRTPAPQQTVTTPSPVGTSGRLEAGALDAMTFRRIAEAQMPMVVSIRSESRRPGRGRGTGSGFGNDLFERFFGMPEPGPGAPGGGDPRDDMVEGAGSGFIIDRTGLVLTNNHVVEGATHLEVGLYSVSTSEADVRTLEAKVIGRDPLTDSALIQLIESPPAGLPAATLGDSDSVEPGDWVVAIGNPFSLAHTVTVGVISAKGRPFRPVEGRVQEMLQTDAAINPGNSGGPLLNLKGEVVGINTAIISPDQRGGNVGIGFAVPIDVVRDLLPQLREGKVIRGRIGVQISSVPREAADELGLPQPEGALVSAVEPGAPAAQAGLKPGDVIVEFNGKPVRTSEELTRMVAATRPGTTVPIKIVRDRKPMTLQVKVEALDLTQEETPPESADAVQDFGLSLAPLTPEIQRQLKIPPGTGGAVVKDVVPRSAAARAGIQPGDVIVEVNRERVSTVRDIAARLQNVPAAGVVPMLVYRNGQEVFLLMSKPR
jgi:serine protease Do